MCLNKITKFGKEQKVIDVVGLPINQAILNLEGAQFSYEIYDSIFNGSMNAISVIKQDPLGGETVKTGRKILLTVNRLVPPKVKMPSLIGFSLESAQLYLKNLSLNIKSITYRNDPSYNIILDVYYQNKSILENTEIKGGAALDLIVGNGYRNIDVDVPNLIGLNLLAGIETLKKLNLKLGTITSQSFIVDTLNSYIIKQDPEPEIEILDSLGQKLKTQNKVKSFNAINVKISSNPFDQ
ncbi:MAG: PASTA domain-containing protein [Alphaproteobacteria bacterium]|nr:PASTA domain-containing protein [Alphaproteobacteria bacterium]